MAGTNWSTVKISLKVRSTMIDLPALERLLGVAHTSFVRKGTKISDSFPSAPLDNWGYQIYKGEAKDFEHDIKIIEDFLAPRRKAIQAVRSEFKYDAELYLSYHSSLAQGGFQLLPDFLKFVGETGLSLIVSILSWGGVEGAPLGNDEEGGELENVKGARNPF